MAINHKRIKRTVFEGFIFRSLNKEIIGQFKPYNLKFFNFIIINVFWISLQTIRNRVIILHQHNWIMNSLSKHNYAPQSKNTHSFLTTITRSLKGKYLRHLYSYITNEDCQEKTRLINALPNNIKTFVI